VNEALIVDRPSPKERSGSCLPLLKDDEDSRAADVEDDYLEKELSAESIILSGGQYCAEF
jgi:hypothetical protein